MIRYKVVDRDGKIIKAGITTSERVNDLRAQSGKAETIITIEQEEYDKIVSGGSDGLPPQNNTDGWAAVMCRRGMLLAMSDWTQIPDSPLTSAQRKAWAAYRQALRDITKQKDPDNIAWPTPPV